MVGEEGVVMREAYRQLKGKKSGILEAQKNNSKFSTSVLEKTKARRKNVRDLRKSFGFKSPKRRKIKLPKPKQSLSYKELYKLGKQKKPFYLKIGGNLHISEYETGLLLGDIVCFATSETSGVACIGIVKKTKKETISVVPLKKETGAKTRTTYCIFKKFVMCRMIKQELQLWRLECVTIDTKKKTKTTVLIARHTNVEDLIEEQRKLAKIAKRYRKNKYYQVRKENVR